MNTFNDKKIKLFCKIKCLHKQQFFPLQHLFHYHSKRPDQQFHHWHQQTPVVSKLYKIKEKLLPTGIFRRDIHQFIKVFIYPCLETCHKIINFVFLATLK